MSNEDELLGMHMITSTPKHPIILQMDLSDGRQKIDIRFSAHPDHKPQNMSRYRLQANLQLVAGVMRHRAKDRQCLAISFQDPPKYYRLTSNPEKTHDAGAEQWKEWPKMWERQTDIDNDMQARDTEPISLVRTDPIIDTGRWLTYRLDLKHDDETIRRVDEFCLALNHHNIQVKEVSDLPLLNRTETEAWKYLDPHKASQPSDLHQMQDDLVHLDFDVRYQLEACISQHCINEYNMKLAFFQQLSGLDKATALNLLENVADSRFMYHDPMTIFFAPELRASRKRRAPLGCVLMHAVTITPTTLRISTPTVEVSNRVIRDYSHHQDRFLRVKFEDEDYIGRLWASATSSNQEEVYSRIERALKQGIDIAGRHYDFLASGCSQFREHGGYFFARLPNLNADMVREKLGQFQVINVVAKYAARIGQCFSTTRSVRQLPRNLNCVTINDVKGKVDQKVYCFTDGVGGVSPFVAQLIADEFRINCPAGDYPSVFQFRMGGNKGVLAVDPELKGITVALRPSQRKFESNTQGLEIIRVSSYATAYLNQQIILVLSSLGVPDKVFVDKMVNELKRIDLAMTHRQTALDLLLKNVDFNQVTVAMAEMIMDGFMETKEPFVLSLLQLWRAWRMKFLKEKAHMAAEQGAFVLGCTDETKTLSMNDAGGLPEIFIQVKDDTGNYKPQEGICLLARNPSLHPGDVRVVKAVFCSKLLHLKDVVVLPQKGDRDLANMCSGGDLDGDDYLVMWDKALFPPESGWNYSPMDFTPPIPRMGVGVVTKDQLTENFINYIKNDRLGTVATLHRAWADWHSKAGGVKHENCQRLAQLHSIAVDFPKSGIPAEIDEYLYQPPKWPHWMEKKGKPKDKIHHSKAVLGQLY
ncbi:RNA dependent RNA polymerase-domain-containing protein, partial [Delphinella strobiligena]